MSIHLFFFSLNIHVIYLFERFVMHGNASYSFTRGQCKFIVQEHLCSLSDIWGVRGWGWKSFVVSFVVHTIIHVMSSELRINSISYYNFLQYFAKKSEVLIPETSALYIILIICVIVIGLSALVKQNNLIFHPSRTMK